MGGVSSSNAPRRKVARLGHCGEARPWLGGRAGGRWGRNVKGKKELAGTQEGAVSKQCPED